MKYLTLLLTLAVVPVCAQATAPPQKGEVLDGRLPATTAQSPVQHHQPLIKNIYVFVPPAHSPDSISSSDLAETTSAKSDSKGRSLTSIRRLDGGVTYRPPTEIESCLPSPRPEC